MDRNRRNIALFYAAFFLQGMVFYSPVATLYRQAAGLTLLQIGAIESVSLGLTLVLEIPWGRWADALGHRRTLVICCALFALTKVIFWRARSFGGFLAERVVLAAVLAGLSGCDSAFLFACCAGTEDHRRAFSRWEALQTAGMLLAALVWPALGGDCRLAALLTVFSYAAAALLALGWREPDGGREAGAARAEPRPALGALLRGTWRLAPVLLAFCLLDQTAQMATVFLNQLQYLRGGIDPRWFGVLQAAATLAALAGGLSHRLTSRLGERRAAAALLGTGALACAAMAVSARPGLAVAGVIALRAARALAIPISLSLQNERAPAGGRAAQLSCNAMLMELGALALNPAFGVLADVGVGTALGFGAVCCVAGGVLLTVISNQFSNW